MQFDPASVSSFFASGNFTIDFSLVADNNDLIDFYSDDYYTVAKLMEIVSIGMSFIVVLELVVAIILLFILEKKNSRQMLITLETIIFMQFTYYSMLGIG
jgi:hypothetical protein